MDVDWQQRWERAHEEHPGMAKSTFVSNYLFAHPDLRELFDWLYTQPDLHNQVLSASAIYSGPDSMVSEPHPTESEMRVHRFDRNRLHGESQIRIAVVTDGKSKLDPPYSAWGEQ